MASSPPLASLSSAEPGSLSKGWRSVSGPIGRELGFSRSSSSTAEAVRVSVRIRPIAEKACRQGHAGENAGVISVAGKTVSVASPPMELLADNVLLGQAVAADGVTSSQEDLFQKLGAPMVHSALGGHNHSLIAYGESGSGKTYSVLGSRSQPGLLPQLADRLLQERAAQSSPSNFMGANAGQSSEIRIWFSALEIFHDQVRDLLATSWLTDQFEEPNFVEHPALGVQIVGAVEVPVLEANDMAELCDYALKRRALSQSCLLSSSSRSHKLFTLRLESRQGSRRSTGAANAQLALQPQACHSRICLFDLASSQRRPDYAAEELGCVRSERDGFAPCLGLASLHAVVQELAVRGKEEDSGSTDVFFQATKLTTAIKDALVGSCYTTMLATCKADSAEESAATLRFAEFMKDLRTSPRPSLGLRSEILSVLHEDVFRLKAQLAAGFPSRAHLVRELSDRSALIEELRRPGQPQADERKRLAREREKALSWYGLLSRAACEEALELEQVTPYLMNMSDDPALAGCLVYFLQRGEDNHIGSDPDNMIVVDGLGVLPFLCSVTNHDNVRVSFMRPEHARRHVLVNGKVLHQNADTKILSHHDRLCLGRAMLLRLHVPMQAGVEAIDEDEEHSGSMKQPTDMELVLSEGVQEVLPPLPRQHVGGSSPATPVSVSSAANATSFENVRPFLEHSESLKDLQFYVKDLLPKLAATESLAAFEVLREACFYIDEANMITKEVRQEDLLSFEVEFVWDIYRVPEEVLLIRLMSYPTSINQVEGQKDDLQPGEEPEQEMSPENPPLVSQVMHYWSYKKFLERLDLMRDVFRLRCQGGRGWLGRGDPLHDPWTEPTQVNFKRQLIAGIIDERSRAATVAALNPVPQESSPQSRPEGLGGRRASVDSLQGRREKQGSMLSDYPSASSLTQSGGGGTGSSSAVSLSRIRTPRPTAKSAQPALSAASRRSSAVNNTNSLSTQSPATSSRGMKSIGPTRNARSLLGSTSARLSTSSDARASRTSVPLVSRPDGSSTPTVSSPPGSPMSGSRTAPVPSTSETLETERLRVYTAELERALEEKTRIAQQKTELVEALEAKLSEVVSVFQKGVITPSATAPVSLSTSPCSREEKTTLTMGAAAQEAHAVAAAVAATPRLKVPARGAGSSPSGSGITAEDEDNCSMTVSTSTHSEGGETGRSSRSWSKQPDNFGISGSEDAASPGSASSARMQPRQAQSAQHQRAVKPFEPDCSPQQDETHKTLPQGDQSTGGQASAPRSWAPSASGSSSAFTSAGLEAAAVPAEGGMQPSQPQTLQTPTSVVLPSRALANVPPAGSPMGSPVTMLRRVPADGTVSYTVTSPQGVRTQSFSPMTMGAGTAAAIASSHRVQPAPSSVPWMQQPPVAPQTSVAGSSTAAGQVSILPLSTTMSPRLASRRNVR